MFFLPPLPVYDRTPPFGENLDRAYSPPTGGESPHPTRTNSPPPGENLDRAYSPPLGENPRIPREQIRPHRGRGPRSGAGGIAAEWQENSKQRNNTTQKTVGFANTPLGHTPLPVYDRTPPMGENLDRAYSPPTRGKSPQHLRTNSPPLEENPRIPREQIRPHRGRGPRSGAGGIAAVGHPQE